MENNDMAVFWVALVVPGVTEPLLDLPLCQVGELHQPGNFCIGDKMVFQVAGFQLCQLLFGLFRPQTECISAESRVLLRKERGQLCITHRFLPCHVAHTGTKYLLEERQNGYGWDDGNFGYITYNWYHVITSALVVSKWEKKSKKYFSKKK